MWVSIWRSIDYRILRYRYGGRNLRALLPCQGLKRLVDNMGIYWYNSKNNSALKAGK